MFGKNLQITQLQSLHLSVSVKCTKSVHLMLHCSYFLGIWLETPSTSLSPVIFDLIRWLDAVNIPLFFFLGGFLSVFWSLLCSAANWMHITNRRSLLSKAIFCYDILFISCGFLFPPFFFSFLQLFFFFLNPWTHDWCVQWHFLA